MFSVCADYLQKAHSTDDTPTLDQRLYLLHVAYGIFDTAAVVRPSLDFRQALKNLNNCAILSLKGMISGSESRSNLRIQLIGDILGWIDHDRFDVESEAAIELSGEAEYDAWLRNLDADMDPAYPDELVEILYQLYPKELRDDVVIMRRRARRHRDKIQHTGGNSSRIQEHDIMESKTAR